MSETNASICKLCYPLVKGAEAVCDLHSARAEITKLKSQLEEARRGLKVALHALKDVDGPVIVYDGENGIFLAKERDCTCWDAEQTIRALLSAPTEARSVLEASNQEGNRMQTIEYRTRDKSEWGHGVWQDEPDKRQWQDAATGFPCLIVRGPGGALCGYVGVSRKHPAFEKEYDSVDVNVHGGLTFASKCAPEPTHERWQEWRKRVLGGADEAKRYPQGDAARRLKERAMELEDYEAYVAWATGSFICHKVDAGEDDEVWWLGFDCAHLGDYSPAFDSKRSYGYADDTYKDFPYVTREVERLAVQLKQMGGASNKEGGKS